MFKQNWLLIIFIFCTAQVSRAQFDSESPYSYYGIGNPVSNPLQQGFAMGGVAQGLRDSCFVNYLNPASYSSIDVTQLVFGFEGNFLTRTDLGQTFNNNNLFINQFGIAIPVIHKHRFVNWGMFLGYAPYSHVGYKLSAQDTVIMGNDTMQASYNYTGTGGLNKLTFGHGVSLGRHFSVGINFHYIFGTSSRIRTLDLPAASGYLSSRVDEKTRVNSFSFDVGAQTYFHFKVKRFITPRKIGIETKDANGNVIARRDSTVDQKKRRYDFKNYRLTIGGTYNFGNSFDAGFEQLGIQYLAGTFNVNVDTFLLNPTQTGNITMPHAFGGGVSLVNPNVWNLCFDFNYKMWSGFKYFDQPGLAFNNSYSLHMGFEWSPQFVKDGSIIDKIRVKGRFFKNILYRFGARYYNRFYRPDSKPVDEVAFSFGMGLPFGFAENYDAELNKKITISYINVGVEGGLANSRYNGLVNESFVRFTVGVTLRDKWFNKRYYN